MQNKLLSQELRHIGHITCGVTCSWSCAGMVSSKRGPGAFYGLGLSEHELHVPIFIVCVIRHCYQMQCAPTFYISPTYDDLLASFILPRRVGNLHMYKYRQRYRAAPSPSIHLFTPLHLQLCSSGISSNTEIEGKNS
ncbi:hypothetical protein TNCV_1543621 [Trichonephila clavipes]|nr:hypothetical protein TNCV_1543621 [Trichonephila clavipes]